VTAEGDSLILHFELRKGAFATTVLREVMKIDAAAMSAAMSAAVAIDDDDGDE
jgi:tRNA(Glu) U13 pseudouridine synthase TruD